MATATTTLKHVTSAMVTLQC